MPDRIDPMTVATRFFNTPLLIEPGKASVIATALGPRFLGLEMAGNGAPALEVDGIIFQPSAEDPRRRVQPRAGSLVADGLFEAVRDRQPYHVVQGVAVIPVVGSLVRRGAWLGESSGTTSYEGLSAQIRAALEDPRVRGIALEVDSFGGEAHGCFELAAEIRAAREVKPIEAFLAEHACSAGYMIAAQADRVTIGEFGFAGSIGVVMMHTDIEGQLARQGVRVTLIHAGAHKVDGNPFEALSDDLRAKWQGEAEAMRLRFAQEVALGRSGRMSVEAALDTEAQTYRGTDAVREGLADQVIGAREGFAAFVKRLGGPAGAQPQRAQAATLAPAFAARVAQAAQVLTDTQQFARVPAALALSIGPLGPETGASALKTGESDMPKGIEQPTADARTDQAEVSQDTGAEAKDAQAGPVAADTDWVLERCDKAGMTLAEGRALAASGKTREEVLEAIIDYKADKADDGGEIRAAGHAVVTGDARDRTRAGITSALLAKAGFQGGERNEFTSMSLREMARASLMAQGIIVRGSTMDLAGAVFAPSMASGGMHSTSDFAAIVANIADKAMLRGFEEAPEVFERFTSTGSLSDFKATSRVGMDSFPSLLEVAEGAEFKHGTMGDHAETAILATYGRLFAITRQTIINDDLDAFTRIPAKMGRAARRTVGDLVFAVLTGNPNMSDGTALFHADHGNLAASGGVPSEASINAAITAMATQKDRGESAHALNIAPRFLIAPPTQRSAVLQALNSEYAPDDTDKAGSAKQPRAHNTVRDAAEPIFDARLTGNAWFMAADPTVHDTIEVGYLDGNPAPFLEQQNGWSIDGTEFKVRIDACATPLAYQTLYKNGGA